MSKRSVWMLVAVALLVVIPLLMGGEFGGSDGQAADLIAAENPEFQPWFEPVWAPPSGEIESLFFTLQAVLGALVVGYVIGRRHGKDLAQKEG